MEWIEKKILPKYFDEVKSGNKNFELREDEDDIQPGDILVLKEWKNGEYTGEKVTKTVMYVLRNVPQYGLMDGYCIIGF